MSSHQRTTHYTLIVLFSLIIAIIVPYTAARQTYQANTTYYVSREGNDQNTGISPQQAWQSITKVEQMVTTLQPGDQVLFERGDVFRGTLDLGKLRGTADQPIIFGAYGEGDAPIFTGLTRLSEWKSIGNNRWQTTCSECGDQVNMLLLDGQVQQIARWPNLDQADKGYYYIDNAKGTTSLTSDELPTNIDWTGGEVVIRSKPWVLDRPQITAQSGNTLTFDHVTYDLKEGLGYFLQNHQAAMDQDGEWVYNPTNKRITLYLTNGSPSDRMIQVPTLDHLWTMTGAHYLTLQDLTLYGARESNLEVTGCVNVTVKQVRVDRAGKVAARFNGCKNLNLGYNTFHNALDTGLVVSGCTDCRVHHNTVENIATFAGMGQSGNGTYNGVRFSGSNSVFEYNRINQIGYIGIGVGNHTTIRYNHITNLNLVKTDGAGIYTGKYANDIDIIDNIVLHGYGDTVATTLADPATHGIYVDDDSYDINIEGNTIAFMGTSGIYLHNTKDINVTDNTVYAGQEEAIRYKDDDIGEYRTQNSTVQNNLFVAPDRTTPVLTARTNKDEQSFFKNLGNIDENLYCNPFAEPTVVRIYPDMPHSDRLISLDAWRQIYSKDVNSKVCDIRYPTYTNIQPKAENQIGNGTFDGDIENWGGWPGTSLNTSWDNDTLDGGSLKVVHTGADNYVHVTTDIGSLEQGKLYRLRFKAMTNQPNREVEVVFQRAEQPWTNLIEKYVSLPLMDTPQTHELFLTPKVSEANARVVFKLAKASQQMWLDNIEIHEVTADSIDPTKVVRFEYNASAQAKTIQLDNYHYITPNGQSYPAGATITLQPYTSLILLQQEAGSSMTQMKRFLPLIQRGT